MRIMRVKLDADTETLLKRVCVQYRLNDFGFVSDLYALAVTKGSLIPDDARATKMAEVYAKLVGAPLLVARTLINKRRALLRSFAANPLFVQLCQLDKHPSEILETLLDMFATMYRHKRASVCATCHLVQSCEFGKQFASSKGIRQVASIAYNTLVHKDCPEKPTLSSNAQMLAGLKQLQEVTQNPEPLASGSDAPLTTTEANRLKEAATAAEQSAASKKADDQPLPKEVLVEPLPRYIDDKWQTSPDDNTEVGFNYGDGNWGFTDALMPTGEPPIRIDWNKVRQIQTHHFVLWEIARKLSSALVKAHKGKFKPTDEVTSNQKTSNIKSIGEVTKVLPREFASDDAVFDKKLMNRSLSKRQSPNSPQKKHLLYVCLDVSGSMSSAVVDEQFTTNVSPLFHAITRATLASLFSLALVELLRSEKGIMFMRMFAGRPSELYSARTDVEYQQLVRTISNCSFRGASTDIAAVLNAALVDIESAKNELRSAEVLLITDCGAHLKPSDLITFRKKFGKQVVLNVLDVLDDKSTENVVWMATELATKKQLKEFADTYFCIDGHASSLDKLVSLVGGTKKKDK